MLVIKYAEKPFWTAVAAVFTLAVTHIMPAENSRILALVTIPGKSHWNFMSSVLRALTDGGHNVTVFTPFPDGNRENYTEVDISSTVSKIVGMNLGEMQRLLNNALWTVPVRMKICRTFCDGIYNDRRVTGLLADGLDGNFDAIVIEHGPSFCLTYAAARTKLPVLSLVPYPKKLFAESGTTGDVPNPAAVSSLFIPHAVPKTFAQRFSNALLSFYIEVSVALFDSAIFLDRRKPYNAYVAAPPSIVFVNGHYISDAARPIPSNIVNVGGIHLKPPGKIPKDVLEFIEDSAHGVVLFTFGSTVLMSSIPDRIKTVLLEALAQLPQRVLMKYEGELKNKPDNVLTSNWLPQRAILVHPKVKLFVSHGGMSGVYEAVDAAVPVLGFPLFSDQYRNIDNLVEAGMAIFMELSSVSADAFLKNVIELVSNDKYKRNAEIASSIFKDRPMSPQQSVVYWTEYAIRHRGAPHLKSQALNLTWYQYFLLDVIAVVLILISIVSFVIYKVFKLLCQYSFKCYYCVIKVNRPDRLKND